MNYDKKRCKIILTPQTPLFIGNGKKLMKKEYVYIDKEKKIYILHPYKFFYFLRKNNLISEYESFMRENLNMSLFAWLKQNSIELTEIQPLIDYTVKVNGNKTFHANEIHCFIKNAYGKPYIPGSSVKGALRTAILVYLLKTENSFKLDDVIQPFIDLQTKDYSSCKDEISVIEGQKYEIEQRIFNHLNMNKKNSHALNDLMRAIRISDSDGINEDYLSLCKKVEVSNQASDNKPKEINLLRESLVCNNGIELEMVLDEKLLNRVNFMKNYSNDYVSFIQQAIEQYSYVVTEYFIKHFQGAVKPQKDMIYLGGGVGFASKTILPALNGNFDAKNVISRMLYNQFPKNHKHDTLDEEVSPHILKCTYEGNDVPVQFGMCKVKIEELNNKE